MSDEWREQPKIKGSISISRAKKYVLLDLLIIF